jgi:hypothetical protein
VGMWCSTVYSKLQHQPKVGAQVYACGSAPEERILTICWLGRCVVPRTFLDEMKRNITASHRNQNPVSLLTEGCE